MDPLARRPGRPLVLVALGWMAGCGGGDSSPSDGGADLGGDAGPVSCVAAVAEVCFEPTADLADNDPLCPNPEPASPDSLDDALTAARLDRCSAAFTAAEWDTVPTELTGDPFLLPHQKTLHDAPLRAPGWARETVAGLESEDLPVAHAIHLAAHRLGHQADAAVCTPDEVTVCLPEAVASLRTRFGAEADVEQLTEDLSTLPADLARALAPIVQAIEEAAQARDDALGDYPAPPFLYDIAATVTLAHRAGNFLDVTQPANRLLLSEQFGYAELYSAAVRLAATIEGADLGQFAGATGFDIEIETPLGIIGIHDAADHTHEPPESGVGHVLLVDTGGEDTYRVAAGATTSVDSRVAVAIDLDGIDEYGYEEQPDPMDGNRLVSDSDGRDDFSGCEDFCSVSMQERQGAARLGIGMLFDHGGDSDTYVSLRMSQGFAALGVGVLFDDGGDDVYVIEAGGQGSGQFGIGLLLDQGGTDRYEAYHLAQGFGFSKGFGALRDAGAGDDTYLCDPGDPSAPVFGDPLYSVVELPGAGNLSHCQGSANGLGFQISCVACMAGGIGVLRDGGGDDEYTTSVFGQGAAFWYGTGILDDEAGNDTYRGLWSVQGAAKDFSLAIFRDAGGNDTYNVGFPVREGALGAGDFFSTAIHLDLGGTDTYAGPRLSLGAANDNSHAYCINIGGTDSYAVAPDERVLGGADEAECPGLPACSPIPKNVAVFVDVGGTDTYPVSVEWGNETSWIEDSDGDTDHTVGWDEAAGDVELP